MSTASKTDATENDTVNLSGRRILVSGGTTGIGRATAIALAQAGAKVFIFGRHRSELDDALQDLQAIGEAAGATADVSNGQDVRKIFQAATDWLGGLDILVNNAALGASGLGDSSDQEWRYVIETNLVGYLAVAKEALNVFEATGRGHIVLIGSMSADVRETGSSIYVATKAAIQGFAESFRKEVNPLGIKVSLIEPGSVGSDMQPETPEEERQKQHRGEMLKAEDIAQCILYVLRQPARCDVVRVQIRPHAQLI